MAKLAIDRASIVFGKKSGDFHSKSGDREIFIILSKIGRSPEKSGDLEALHAGHLGSISIAVSEQRLAAIDPGITSCLVGRVVNGVQRMVSRSVT